MERFFLRDGSLRVAVQSPRKRPVNQSSLEGWETLGSNWLQWKHRGVSRTLVLGEY